MSLLWCGGEDIDFPNGGATVGIDTTAGHFRSNYARCAVYNSGATATSARSVFFANGKVISCWLHFRLFVLAATANIPWIGLGSNASGTQQLVVGIGTGAVNSTTGTAQLVLWNYFDGSYTTLATEPGYSIAAGADYQIDVQIVGLNTVTVYLNGNVLPAISWTGTILEPTPGNDLDCAGLAGQGGINAACSEIIVTDSVDTRLFSLQTLNPAGAGTTNAWDAGNYSNINPVAINDASVAVVNSTGKDLQSTLPPLTTGRWTVPGTKVIARAAVSAGAVPGSLCLGYNIGGLVIVDADPSTGRGHIPTSVFTSYERKPDNINPKSGLPWTQGDLNSLQLDLESAA